MNNNRVIFGAFNTGSDNQLPSGRSRVARVHVKIIGPGERLWHTELTTSASSDGRNIPAELSISKARGLRLNPSQISNLKSQILSSNFSKSGDNNR
jgi:hypothetical protein